MNVRTINLTGSEVAVKVGGGNSEIKNNGTETIFASASSGVVAGADGVVSIPAGASVTVTDTCGTVYILGTGGVEVVGKDFVAPVFKSAASSGGGTTEDTVAREAIGAHERNGEIHVTASEKAAWNGLSNSNLLINPDFYINQRGNSSYSGGGYTVDRWSSFSNTCTVTLNDKGVSVSDWLFQMIDEPQRLIGKEIVISALVKGNVLLRLTGGNVSWATSEEIAFKYINTGNEFQIVELNTVVPEFASSFLSVILSNNSGSGYFDVQWVKLELGSVATPFTPPDPATELAKCQRYYQIRSTGDIAAVDLRPSMATIKDIRQREDGNYEYIAEL